MNPTTLQWLLPQLRRRQWILLPIIRTMNILKSLNQRILITILLSASIPLIGDITLLNHRLVEALPRHHSLCTLKDIKTRHRVNRDTCNHNRNTPNNNNHHTSNHISSKHIGSI